MWISENGPPRTIVRRNRSEPKTLFCLFFKSDDPILVHKVDKGKTIDHKYYIENCLKPVINKYENKKKHHIPNVSNYSMIMVVLIVIAMLLTT